MSEELNQPHVLSLSRFIERVPDRAIYLLVGTLQGLATWGLVEHGEWLTEHPTIAFPLWLLVLVWPTLFMLSFAREYCLRALAWVSGLSALLVSLALYTGWQLTPHGEFEANSVAVVFALPMLVATFVALLHLQTFVWRKQRTYNTFFTLSWRNFLTFGLSAALTLGIRLVLFLWESLFAAIGVDFFNKLFAKEWFLLPVLGASFAFGLHSFRAATSVIDSISSLLARLTWLLLPILVFVTTAFLLTLPFVGLQPLWDTDYGTAILMAANFLALLFLNAVYQTGQRVPYPLMVHKLLTIGVAILPMLSALAFYGLALRVGQYGWTVSRGWALLIALLMTCFSLGYLYIIVRRRALWLDRLPEINGNMSWVVLVLLLLTASPVADFRNVAAWSQFNRIEAGEDSIHQLDVRYIQEELARPGYLKMQSLLAQLDETDASTAQELRAAIEARRSVVRKWTEDQQAQIFKRPASFNIPESLSHSIRNYKEEAPQLLFQVDLNDDGTPEYVAVWIFDTNYYASVDCWHESSTGWEPCGHYPLLETSDENLLEELAAADFEAVMPSRPYKDLRVGEHLFEFD